jgi:hypothetical protein
MGVTIVQNPSHFMIRAAAPAAPGRRARGPDGSGQGAIAAGVPFAIGSDGVLNPFSTSCSPR